MTTQAIPDPIGLKSWEEAFQYPLPTVQKLSLRLRRDIDDHRNRLRSLVGASYRDLLGTAERIIDMDSQIQIVESSLSDIGRRCNSRMIERGDANYTTLEQSWGRRDGEEEYLGTAARVTVLSAASAMVERLVKRGGNALQAAKLMVLSRLLYKSLEGEDGQHAKLERQRRRISSLRNRLLLYVDTILSKPSLEPDLITSTLSAFALLSSSKLRDVLRHFLAVRLAQLETLSTTATSSGTLDVLTLYIDTIQLVQTIFPKRISESLSDLGKIPLLSNKDIKQVAELNLDIYGRWIAEDIWSFRPWVQQEGFPGKEAREELSQFSTKARSILLSTLRQCLQDADSAAEVLSIREKILTAYLSLGSHTKIDDLPEHVEELRTAFLEHMESLAKRTAAIDDFDLSTHTSIDSRSPPRPSIWSLADDDFDLSSGGINLRRSVLRLRQGHDPHFDQAVAPLQAWHERVIAFSETLDKMRSIRWDEHFDADYDEGEEELGKVFQSRFATDDPARIAKCLREHVEKSLAQTVTAIEQTMDVRDEGFRPDILLRVVRDFHRHEQLIRASIKSQPQSTATQHSLIQSLHRSLAQQISEKSFPAFEHSLSTTQYVATDLWDGTPPLPLQPLPSVFRFVMALQRDMTSYNEDVWSVAAVNALRSEVAAKLAQALLQEPVEVDKAEQSADHSDGPVTASSPISGAADSGEQAQDSAAAGESTSSPDQPAESQAEQPEQVDGSAQPDTQAAEKQNTHDQAETEASKQETLHKQRIQRVFDAMYLKSIFASHQEMNALSKTVEKLKDRAQLETNDLQRLEKSSSEYWKRSYLLFGLLAPTSASIAASKR